MEVDRSRMGATRVRTHTHTQVPGTPGPRCGCGKVTASPRVVLVGSCGCVRLWGIRSRGVWASPVRDGEVKARLWGGGAACGRGEGRALRPAWPWCVGSCRRGWTGPMAQGMPSGLSGSSAERWHNAFGGVAMDRAGRTRRQGNHRGAAVGVLAHRLGSRMTTQRSGESKQRRHGAVPCHVGSSV